MEGQELQGDHAEDALQAVHGGGQLDHLVGELGALGVVLGAQYNRATLKQRKGVTKRSSSLKEAPLTGLFLSSASLPGGQ